MEKKIYTDLHIFSGLTVNSLSANTIFSGSTNLGTVINNVITSQSGNYFPTTGGTVNGDVNITGNLNVLGTASTFDTQRIQVENNQIILNYSGTNISAINGGIFLTSGQTNGAPSTILIDTSGNWKVNPGLSAQSISATTLYSGTTNLSQTIINAGIFTSDITVSLSGGKTLGRYVSGDVIPASGKSAQQVFNLIAVEPISPTVNLSSPTTVQFNQSAITNVLNFSYTINSLGASVSSVSLETRRNNTGAWTALTTSVTATTFTHSLTDSAFNTQPFNYRYIVIDTAGASATATTNVTPVSYVAPSITFSAPATSILSPETNTIREKGNISSIPQGSVSRNSPFVNVQSYQIYYSLNGGGNVAIGTSSGLTATGGVITAFTHNNLTLSAANTINYFVFVTDDFTSATNTNYLITFKNLIFYAPVASQPLTSADVRALTNRIFTDGSNPFTLNTGTVYDIFSTAMPATLSITSVIDLDALNADITASYVLSTFNVNDAAGTAVSYHVYTMTNAVTYASNHRHQISR